MKPVLYLLLFAFLFTVLLLPSSALAQISEFGGSGVRYSGDGDLEPPSCGFNVPSVTTEPFSAVWNCVDSDSEPSEIRTQLWIIRQGAARPVLLENFLGFPAGLSIDESTLGVTNFTDGLPFQLRLVATDRAGNSALSPVRTISTEATSSSNCTLSVVTEVIEATETTTGIPSMTVELINASVRSITTGTNTLSVSTSGATGSATCEIDSLCENSEEIEFDSLVTFSSEALSADSDSTESDLTGDDLTATINIFPGDLTVSLEGEGFFTESGDVSLNATGSTSIENTTALQDTVAEVTLSCSP